MKSYLTRFAGAEDLISHECVYIFAPISTVKGKSRLLLFGRKFKNANTRYRALVVPVMQVRNS